MKKIMSLNAADCLDISGEANKVRVLHITAHLGGGLGTAISSYIAESKIEHTVLELEKSINPCLNQINLNIITMSVPKELAVLANNYDVLLFHYHCHPLIVWALLEINRFPGNKVIVWCHNNGLNALHPLPDNLNEFANSVILSGCRDNKFSGCEIIRPRPLMTSLNEAAKILSIAKKVDTPSFRYIGSLNESKIHECAFEWFGYLSGNWKFDIATLDLDHNFSNFKVLVGETRRSVLYDHFFCLVYPLRDNHYGCGELVLQELLMLGYPVIIRRNNVETEIVEGLSGVYYADSVTELDSACLEIVDNWHLLLEDWWARSAYNIKIIESRKPYVRLDLQINQVYRRGQGRKKSVRKPDSLDIIKFAYNQNSDEGLDEILLLWDQSGRGKFPNKGSPAQFLKYFPDLKHLHFFTSNFKQAL